MGMFDLTVLLALMPCVSSGKVISFMLHELLLISSHIPKGVPLGMLLLSELLEMIKGMGGSYVMFACLPLWGSVLKVDCY